MSQDITQQLAALLPQDKNNVELIRLLLTPLPATYNDRQHLSHEEQVLVSRFQALTAASVFDRELAFLRHNEQRHLTGDEDSLQPHAKQDKEKENIEAAWKDAKLVSMLRMSHEEERLAIDKMLTNYKVRWARCPSEPECEMHKRRLLWVEKRLATLIERLRKLRKRYCWARIKYIAKFYGRQLREHFLSPLNCLLTTWLVCFCFSISH